MLMVRTIWRKAIYITYMLLFFPVFQQDQQTLFLLITRHSLEENSNPKYSPSYQYLSYACFILFHIFLTHIVCW